MILNPDQQAAVLAPGHTVVVACPGSGKTRVLVERAARLRAAHPEASIVVVTFTRQAARELRERLSKKMATLARTRVATFHSLALQQILSGSDARICKPGDQMALLRRAWFEFGDDEGFRGFASAVDAVAAGGPSALDNLDYLSAYDRYLELLLHLSVIDFSQAILKAVSAMRSGELTPIPCQYLLVDEVQDIDGTQLKWVIAHTDQGACLTVVGDDDQSLYGFRHSLGFGGMRRITQALEAEVITLSVNYRSHSEILEAASQLIGENTNRIPKALSAAKGPGGRILLHDRCWTDVDEAERLAANLGSSREPCAVIARTNAKLDRVASVLDEKEIPYSRPGRARFWDSEEPSLFLGLLSPVGLDDPLTLSAACTHAGVAPSDHQRAAPIVELKAILQRHRDREQPSSLIQVVCGWLRTHMAGVAESRQDGIGRIIDACQSAMLKMPGHLDARIIRALRPAPTKLERIVLVTMHGAKGLEWPTVWIYGCQDGVVPNRRATDLEEERRLLYVAMTRAEQTLHLSFAWNQLRTRRTGETYPSKLTPSRFLSMDLGLPIPSRGDIEAMLAAVPQGPTSYTDVVNG